MNMLVSIISPTETFWISKISHSPRRRKYLTPVPVHACTNKHTITDYKYEQIDRPSKSRSRTIFNLLFFVLPPSWNKNIIRLVAPTPAISSIQDGNDEEELVQTCARTRHWIYHNSGSWWQRWRVLSWTGRFVSKPNFGALGLSRQAVLQYCLSVPLGGRI